MCVIVGDRATLPKREENRFFDEGCKGEGKGFRRRASLWFKEGVSHSGPFLAHRFFSFEYRQKKREVQH